MASLIRMPEVAANTTSAAIVSWSKAEGDIVSIGDCLAEIETEKAVIELNAEGGGVLGRILVPAGSEASVGQPIAVLFTSDGQNADIEALLAADGWAGADSSDPITPMPDQQGAFPDGNLTAASEAPAENTRGRIFASPVARRLAGDGGLELADISGSGPQGRIIKRDVMAALDAREVSSVSGTEPATQPAAMERAHKVTPHTSMRRSIARRLLESKATIPHFYLRSDCNMDALMGLREEVNAAAAHKVSVNDLIVKAVAAALRDTPDMNVSWTEDALIQYEAVDVSVAVATDTGLLTPVIRNAHTKPVSAISAEIANLASRARQGRLAPHEYQGGSFTVSNLGMYGVTEFAAIINPPQAAILAVGAVQARAVVGRRGMLAVASMMSVTLSVDHRAVDGAVAARWLGSFKRFIEHPLAILI